MKSGIVTRNDPFLMDPSLMVDPNLILDYGSSFKGTNASDFITAIFNQLPSYNELTGRSILDEVQCSYTDSLMDLINYDDSDSQLENIILGGAGLCGSFDGSLTPEHDFEEFLKGLEIGANEEESQTRAISSSVDLTPPLTPVHQPDDQLSTFIFESGIANFEEVYATHEDAASVNESPASVLSDATVAATELVEEEDTDTESVHSFSTESSSITLKRKQKDDDDEDFCIASPEAPKPKRRKTAARRVRRVQDDRVKNQNKVAAMKYRKKKRDEKSVIDVELEAEEEKNKKLKASVEELKVNIDVLKELLGKYLSPSQLEHQN